MGSLLIKTERTVKENKNNCPNIEFAMHILMGEDWEEGLVKGREWWSTLSLREVKLRKEKTVWKQVYWGREALTFFPLRHQNPWSKSCMDSQEPQDLGTHNRAVSSCLAWSSSIHLSLSLALSRSLFLSLWTFSTKLDASQLSLQSALAFTPVECHILTSAQLACIFLKKTIDSVVIGT